MAHVPLETLHALGLLPERCMDCDSRRCVDFACRQTCEHGMRLDLCAGPEHYPMDEDSPPMTMADESRWQHANFGTCSFDCSRCDQSGEWEEMQAPAYTVQTCYGTLDATTLAEAKTLARQAAMATGKRTTITKTPEA